MARRTHAADTWPAWTDADTWELGPEPSDADREWAEEELNQGDPGHDLDGTPDDADAWELHPTIDDADLADEAAYQQEQERRHAADPTDEELDALASEAAWLDSYEDGIKTI